MTLHPVPWAVAACAAACLVAGSALAQTPVQQPPTAPNMPSQRTTPPEKVTPKGGETTGSTTLSDRLQASDGVIKPPAGMDSGIVTQGPVPNPGTTPMIPPAGTPGSARPNADPR